MTSTSPPGTTVRGPTSPSSKNSLIVSPPPRSRHHQRRRKSLPPSWALNAYRERPSYVVAAVRDAKASLTSVRLIRRFVDLKTRAWLASVDSHFIIHLVHWCCYEIKGCIGKGGSWALKHELRWNEAFEFVIAQAYRHSWQLRHVLLILGDISRSSAFCIWIINFEDWEIRSAIGRMLPCTSLSYNLEVEFETYVNRWMLWE